jgi:SPP1 family phage portal protein
LQWLDSAAQVRYSQVNPLNAFAIYDNTLDCELLAFVRWYKANTIDDSDIYHVVVYDNFHINTYECHGLGGSLKLISSEAHYFKDVPVSVFYLNETEENIFNSIISLNDAYNELQSSEIDDFNAWVDAYLVLKGVDAETDDIGAMKENRVLVLPQDAAAEWLTKNANDTQIVNMLENIKKNIFKVTACPDMADENFLAQSGTALAYKLVGFENVASGIVARFTKAIQRRIELICNVLNLKASEAVWRDININFVRNLPVNITEIIQLVTTLKGTVSDATLLSQLPFIDDVQAELEALEKQKAENMALYNFGVPTAADEEENETE